MPKNDAERTEAINYVSEHMYKKHHAHPPRETTPQHLFIALSGTTIVGAVGIQFGHPSFPLPFEQLYTFDYQTLPVQFARHTTIYYSRWNSSRKELGPPLWLAATEYAISKGMIHGVAITKNNMIAHCKQVLGFDWRVARDAVVNELHVKEHERTYFFCPDPPVLCFSILKDDVTQLRILVKDICTRQQVSFEV